MGCHNSDQIDSGSMYLPDLPNDDDVNVTVQEKELL